MLKKLLVLVALAVGAITMTAKVAVAGDCPNCAASAAPSPQGIVVSPQSPISVAPIIEAAPYAYPAPCVACAPKKKCCLPKLKLPKCDVLGKLHALKTKVCVLPKPKLFSKKVPCHTTWPTGCSTCGNSYVAGPEIIAGPAPIYGAPQSIPAPSAQVIEAAPQIADSAPVFSAPAPAPQAAPLPLPAPHGGH